MCIYALERYLVKDLRGKLRGVEKDFHDIEPREFNRKRKERFYHSQQGRVNYFLTNKSRRCSQIVWLIVLRKIYQIIWYPQHF
jgi:hypothetical protein